MKSLLTLLICFPILIAAQPDTSGQHRLIKGLLDYRHELIARNPEGFKKLYLLDTLWRVEDKEAINDMMLGVTYLNKLKGMSAEQIISVSRMVGLDTFQYRHLLTEGIIDAIIKNDDLALLIGEQVLKPKPPFLLNPENSLFEELAFYDIANGMHVAEIGVGSGMFSLLLGVAYDSLTIYMNDIELNSMNFAYDRVNRCQSIKGNNQYFAVQGKKKSTLLEAYPFDKIIIRNSFHHFSNKDKMLASIKKSMTQTGELILFEPDKIEGSDNLCPLTMEVAAIRAYLSDNGFQIVEEKRIEKWDWVLIRCKLASSN